MLGRPLQLRLVPDQRGWDEIPPPLPAVAEAATAAMYAKQWDAIVAAATEVGWSPADVEREGTEAFADALRQSGVRAWSHNTVVRYAKLLRYAGVEPHRHPSPVPYVRNIPYDPSVLWAGGRQPISDRNSLLAMMTWHWPFDLLSLHVLSVDAVSEGPAGSITVGDGIVVVRGGELWGRWSRYLREHDAGSIWAATRPGPTGRRPGSRLSLRGLQYAFRNHALACGVDITWRDYHAAALNV